VHWEFYPPETPVTLVRFFEEELVVMENPTAVRDRIRVHYGDRITGARWNIPPDVGYVALAIGEEGNPIRFMLLHNSRSTQGPGVMMERIIKLEYTSNEVQDEPIYRHPNFHKPVEDAVAVASMQFADSMRQFRKVRVR
jgi:hypothetical protein